MLEETETTQTEDQEISEAPLETENEEDSELPPPEDKNDANEINVGNILGLIMIGILVIVIFSFVAVNLKGKSKKEKANNELDKAGTKTVIEFREKQSVTPVTPDDFTDDEEEFRKEEDIDSILETLPAELELPQQGEIGKAPVTPTGSTGTTTAYSRPDTRNSKSPRKIEGLGGLEYKNQTQTIASVLNGNSQNRMSKEEYVAYQMAQVQNLQSSLYSDSGKTGSNVSGLKESFFQSNAGTGGNGSWLSTASLWDGTIISGALITAINTDNPGVVIARVTENVYSSQDHRYLLIPEGSLLIANYNSSVSYGQKQVQVAWNLLIRPDGYRVNLGNFNGVTSQGESGYKGSVTNHPFETLKALGLVAIFSIIQTEVTADINSENNEYLKNAMTDVYSQSANLGNRIIDRALDIKPTIKIKQGTEIKLITNIPLELPPVEHNTINQKYVRTSK